MKNKKGFTLVELLAVIVVLSLIITIAVPASINTSKKVKQKMLNNKLTLASQSAVLWAQDNKSCLNTINSCGITCQENSTDNTVKCLITLGKLAEEDYLDYDDKTKSEVTNPVDKSTINGWNIRLIYNKENKSVNVDCIQKLVDTVCS